MDKIRSAFNSMMRSERYSRFTLHPGENGERHAEVNLSDDVTNDATEMEVDGSPSFRPAPIQQSRRTLVFMILGVLLIFVFGYLVGYISHKKPWSKSSCEEQMNNQMDRTNETKASATAWPVPPPDVQLTWQDVTQLLKDKLTTQAFEQTLSDFDLPSRSAGSEEDIILANRILHTFKSLNMETWTDRHYVQLQTPDSNLPNSIQFGSAKCSPGGYLAYSAPGRVHGRLVYGNYGRQEDLELVQKSVDLTGCVLLLRAGSISFAQQVDNAAKMGASAVLIYLDPQDYKMVATTELYGHVHLGSGDPYTPGFPSFNHTQFAQTKSSGLPKIPAQTITASFAATLLQKIGGPNASNDFKGGIQSMTYKLGGVENVTVEVNNVLVNKELHNVFGVIKGFIDPDRYVVLGAQRDAWGKGYAKAAVGTSVLVELAKALHDMVEKDGFRPRRSLVFASWSAGEYGSVGATEWLEGYMSSIDKSAITYISLDGVVMGHGSFIASASPLLTSLIESTMKEVKMPVGSEMMYKMMGENKWEAKVLRPMSMDDPAYPFLAFSGIPSVSFHFISENTESYAYYGTNLDSKDNLAFQTKRHTSEIMVTAAQFAGQMALRLVHDHLVNLDMNRYGSLLTKAVAKINKHVIQLSRSGDLKGVSPKWLSQARGSYQRAADNINKAIVNTDLTDREACRILNDRIMRVEHSLLSPYVSPVETPFRHLLLGRGSHTLESITKTTDLDQLRTQLALATWNLQGCADAMVENIWDIDNEI